MLEVFCQFREILDEQMIDAMHKRVILWGNGYSGRFLKWYAKYYHSIEIDYLISLDMKTGQSYEEEIFRKTILEFNYKDVRNAVMWISEPLDSDDATYLARYGYEEGKNLVNFSALCTRNGLCTTGIQFMSVLENKYGCDFLNAVETKDFTVDSRHAHAYRCTTQKELFPILDGCHCIPKHQDAIFDFGCGKGAALVSFLDYGFEQVGGVEYEPKLFETCKSNMEKLKLNRKIVQLLKGDAADLDEELDNYNWFYFFQPFDRFVFSACIKAITNSYGRNRRKIRIISISPTSHDIITGTEIFRLTNQFSIAMRQRVVDVYETFQ